MIKARMSSSSTATRVFGALWLTVTIVTASEAANVLFLTPIAPKSHMNFYTPIVKTLAKNDNQVTYVVPRPVKEMPHVRQVIIPAFDELQSLTVPNYFDSKGSMSVSLWQMFNDMPQACGNILSNPDLQALFNEDYQVIVLGFIFSDCLLVFKHHFKDASLIYVNPNGLEFSRTMVGNPFFPSYTPTILVPYTNSMSFFERLVNTVMEATFGFFFDDVLYRLVENDSRNRGLIPNDMPPFFDLRLNASFIIINSVRTAEYPRAYLPTVIHAGGIHCAPSEPITDPELESWLQESGNAGFIFFSLGSVIKTSDMPESFRKMLLNVFGSLEQRVLWKWDEDSMPDLPPNVKIGKWLPQQDLLGHEKIRLFINHGGLHSVMETVYHGVPNIGFPISGDQKANLARLEKEGLTKMLIWNETTEETLRSAVMSVLNDNSMIETLKKRAAVMQDRLVPVETEVSYWVDYAVRHGGAAHLRTPARFFPFWKLYNMDVWALLGAALILILYISFSCCACLVRKFRGKSKSKTD